MSKKRTKLDIIESILTSLKEKQGKMKQTRLMYKANLSHTQMKQYLDELFELNILAEEDVESYKYIILTEKGFMFAEDLQKLKEFESLLEDED